MHARMHRQLFVVEATCVGEREVYLQVEAAYLLFFSH